MGEVIASCHHLTYFLDDIDQGKSLTSVLFEWHELNIDALIEVEDVIGNYNHSVLGMSVGSVDFHALLYSLVTRYLRGWGRQSPVQLCVN